MGGDLTEEMQAHMARSIDRLWSQLAAGLLHARAETLLAETLAGRRRGPRGRVEHVR
jgi:hypothetical protein